MERATVTPSSQRHAASTETRSGIIEIGQSSSPRRTLNDRSSKTLSAASTARSTGVLRGYVFAVSVTFMVTWYLSKLLQGYHCNNMAALIPSYIIELNRAQGAASDKTAVHTTAREKHLHHAKSYYRPPKHNFGGSIPSRVWDPIKWECFKNSRSNTVVAGDTIFLHRVTRVHSTPISNILRRLVHNKAPDESTTCPYSFSNGPATYTRIGTRKRPGTVLLSAVRDPTERAISEFFHSQVSRSYVVPSDINFVKNLRNAKLNFVYPYVLTLRKYSNATDGEVFQGPPDQTALLQKAFGTLRPNWYTIVQDILHDYDFIFVAERLAESLVVFQMLMGLTTKDILYHAETSHKHPHPFIFVKGQKGKKDQCIFDRPPFYTPQMKSFFAGPQWHNTIRVDSLVHSAVDLSLNRTIESLGRGFQKNLDAFHRGMETARVHCHGRIIKQCPEGGVISTNNTCYMDNEGCDHVCINDLVL